MEIPDFLAKVTPDEMLLVVGVLIAVALVAALVNGIHRARKAPRPPNRLCPGCRSANILRDSASPWIFVLAAVFFPIGLILFAWNPNVYCRACGIRFRK